MGSPHCASRRLSMEEIGGKWNELSSSLARPLGGRMGGNLIVSPTGSAPEARATGGRDDVGDMSAEVSPCAAECAKRDAVDDRGLGYGE